MDTSVEEVVPLIEPVETGENKDEVPEVETADEIIKKDAEAVVEEAEDTSITTPETTENTSQQTESVDEDQEAKPQDDTEQLQNVSSEKEEEEEGTLTTDADREDNEVTVETTEPDEETSPVEEQTSQPEEHLDQPDDSVEQIASSEKEAEEEIMDTEITQAEEQVTTTEYVEQDDVVEEIVVNHSLTRRSKVEASSERKRKLSEEDMTESNMDSSEEIVIETQDVDLKKEKHSREEHAENGKSAIIEFDNATQETGTVVVVATDGEGKEIILQTSDALHEGTVTVQQVTDETGQIYLLETMDNVIVMEDEDSPERVEIVEVHHPKNLPRHVLGRNIINPAVDTFRNGKAPPKPRLGVKIPYRNLTSQIVSKQEITNEILERSRRMQKDSPKGQNLFAKKLTQTLAKKLAPSKKAANENSSKSNNPGKGENSKERKLNNSDLIAILEGDGEPEPEPEPETKPVPPVESVPMTKELEREIALKQLSELPDDPPETIQEKNKDPKKKPQKPEEAPPEKPQKPIEDSNVKKTKRSKNSEGGEDELPRFSSNVPLKTYTRKRKPSDEATPQDKAAVVSPVNNEDSTKKIDLPVNSNNYMTKSSRIIKKKIIWDPDEVSPRKMMKSSEVPLVKDKILTNKNDLKESSNAEKKTEKDKREVTKTEKKTEKVVEETKSEKGSSEKTVVKKLEKPEQLKKAETLKKNQSPKTEPIKMDKRIIVKTKDNKTKIIELKSSNDKLAALKFKKRLTEVDKLLMDEGAVNMLYSFKNTEEDQNKKKASKSLVSKTNELLNDLQTNTEKVSPKALRKKESLQIAAVKTPRKATSSPVPSAVSRQKSRDSNRSSVHSPPPSPATVCSAEASRIIRRHSSSSFSSMDDDEDGEEREKDKTKVKKTEMRATRKKAELAEASSMDDEESEEKERDKTKVKKTEMRATRRKADLAAESPKKKMKKEVTDVAKEKSNEEMSKSFSKLVDVEPEVVVKYSKFKTLTVVKIEQLMEVILSPNQEQDLYINIEVMQELICILKELETDSDCNLVVISSSASSFTNGIDFKMLLAPKEVTRKSLAKKLATNVRDFLLALANFPKVLVAGVHGDVYGLGVTMLPLFDIIIATDSSSFSTPYAQLGCIAEGGSLLPLSQSHNILVSELLYDSKVLKSSEALRLGLITRILADDDFQVNLRISLKDMCNQSAQFMEATKKQLRQRMIPDITAALNSETEALVQQWISPECQRNFTEIYSA